MAPREHSTPLDGLKAQAAEAAVKEIRDGMLVGLGSGSTAAFVVREVGRLVSGGLRVVAVATSEETAALARSLNIPLSTLAEAGQLDITIDGADEVELPSLDLIKGRGGALLREKIVAISSRRFVVVVDETKIVDRLGIHDPVPIEIVPFAWESTENRVRALGGAPVLRHSKKDSGQPYLTDGGHYILDCSFGGIDNPRGLAASLDGTVGVVEHGLFLGITAAVYVARQNGVEVLNQPPAAK